MWKMIGLQRMDWMLALSGRQEYERVKDELDKSHLTVVIAVRWLFFCYSTTMFLSCMHDKNK